MPSTTCHEFYSLPHVMNFILRAEGFSMFLLHISHVNKTPAVTCL